MIKGLTTNEAAERLNVSPARVRRLVLDGRLRAQKFGRDLVFDEADLASFERLKGGRPRKAATDTPKSTKKRAGKRKI